MPSRNSVLRPSRAGGSRLLWILTVALAVCAGPFGVPRAAADGGGAAVTGAFANLEPGGRGAALAGALGPVVDDPSAIHWNPARLLELSGSGMEITYADLFGLGLVHHTGVFLAWPRHKRTLSWDAGNVVAEISAPTLAWGLALQSTIVDLEPESYSEYDLAFAFAKRGSWEIAYSAVIHGLFVRSDLEETKATGFSLDLALARALGQGFEASLVLRALLSSLNWEGSENENLTPRVQAGLSWTLHPNLRIPVEATWDFKMQSFLQLAAGAEWLPVGKTLALRGGMRWRDDGDKAEIFPGAGLGLAWKQIVFDYGMAIGREELGETHRLSLRYEF